MPQNAGLTSIHTLHPVAFRVWFANNLAYQGVQGHDVRVT